MTEQSEAINPTAPPNEDSRPQEKRWGRGMLYAFTPNVDIELLHSPAGGWG